MALSIISCRDSYSWLMIDVLITISIAITLFVPENLYLKRWTFILIPLAVEENRKEQNSKNRMSSRVGYGKDRIMIEGDGRK